VYRQVTPESMFSLLRTGELDVLHGITGAEAIGTAFGMEDTGHYQAIRYDNNGYTALQFRCDRGPTAYADVRRGIAYLTDREKLVEEMLGEYGETVNAPYSQTLRDYDPLSDFEDAYLVDYEVDVARAVSCFEAAGFVLGEDGQPYEGGIRCRALREGEAMTGRCFTAGDLTLMPLVIDWCTYEGSADAEYIRMFLTETKAAEEAGISFVCTELPFAEYLRAMRDAEADSFQETETDTAGEAGMFDMYRFFGRVYDFSNVFSDRAVFLDTGVNASRVADRALADSAFRTVYGVRPEETEVHLDGLFAFAAQYNDLVPELPLYASVTVDLFSTKIHGYGGSMSSVAQATMKCSVGK